MKWSWTLGRIAGIKLRMHWTFLLLLIWVGMSFGATGGLQAAIEGIAFILAVFACVVLHECGHALTARRYGVPTQDITLLPIGGVARMQRIPEHPIQEFWIAVAGPAVNVVIAGVLFTVLWLAQGLSTATAQPSWGTSFFTNLMWVNIFLVGFNVLPAFPMDGGRVLRALLATQMDYVQATRIAATTGQGMAILFGFAGFFVNPLLLFIALFVFLGAEAEAQMVELRDALRGLSVRDAMMTQFHTLSSDASLEEAVDELLAGAQQDFPVTDSSGYRGILSRKALVNGLREDGMQGRVERWTSDQGKQVGPDEPLVSTLESMRDAQLQAVPVFQQEQLIGMLCMENISELVMIRSATSHTHEGQVAEKSANMVDAA